MIYPVISLKQPWCGWVLAGVKPIETRTHNRFKNLLGKTFLIHASKGSDNGWDAIKAANYLDNNGKFISDREGFFKSGCILGGATCYGFKTLNKDHYSEALIECESTKRYGSFLKDPFLLPEPIEEDGELNVWYYDLEKRCKVKRPIIDTGTLFEYT